MYQSEITTRQLIEVPDVDLSLTPEEMEGVLERYPEMVKLIEREYIGGVYGSQAPRMTYRKLTPPETYVLLQRRLGLEGLEGELITTVEQDWHDDNQKGVTHLAGRNRTIGLHFPNIREYERIAFQSRAAAREMRGEPVLGYVGRLYHLGGLYDSGDERLTIPNSAGIIVDGGSIAYVNWMGSATCIDLKGFGTAHVNKLGGGDEIPGLRGPAPALVKVTGSPGEGTNLFVNKFKPYGKIEFAGESSFMVVDDPEGVEEVVKVRSPADRRHIFAMPDYCRVDTLRGIGRDYPYGFENVPFGDDVSLPEGDNYKAFTVEKPVRRSFAIVPVRSCLYEGEEGKQAYALFEYIIMGEPEPVGQLIFTTGEQEEMEKRLGRGSFNATFEQRVHRKPIPVYSIK